MLLGNFFTISNKAITASNVTATVHIDATHKIFEGHFPGQPVVPGVCMMQMIKEILETVVEKKLQMKKADSLKFLSVINPVENPQVISEFSYDDKGIDGITVNGRLYKDAITFLKFKGTFIPNRRD